MAARMIAPSRFGSSPGFVCTVQGERDLADINLNDGVRRTA